jgi:Lrp/AsnC family transcriptional regulator, leucine-responsive regulatory protein
MHLPKPLDKLDIQLLACLQENNLQTADMLAEQVGRSPSAIARRLRRLRASGAVAADVSVISEDSAGFPLTAVVQVQFERHAAQDIGLFRRRVCASPNVQIYLDLAGPFDVLLIVVATDMDDYNAFAQAMLEQSPVRRFETTFVKKRVKASLAVPLDRTL